MAPRFRKVGDREKHYITEWRNHRRLSQEQLAAKIRISNSTLSRIEAGRLQYAQEFIEACAQALDCSVCDLIGWPPGPLTDILRLCGELPAAEQRRAVFVLEALRAAAARWPDLAAAELGAGGGD